MIALYILILIIVQQTVPFKLIPSLVTGLTLDTRLFLSLPLVILKSP